MQTNVKKQDAVFLGIDAGTTNIKLSMFDLSMNEIDSCGKKTTIYNSCPGASEIDMNELWDDLCVCTQKLKSQQPEAWAKIAGVGISGQGDGLWPLDQDNRPARRALLWNDSRSKILNLDATPGLSELLSREYANTIFAGSMPALQKYLKVTEPETYAKIRTSLHCKDWLNFKLTGRVVSDYSDITCSSGMNMKTKQYIPELYQLLDIPEALETMPEAVDPTDIIGTISEQAAKDCGIAAGTPVMAGCLDCCAVSTGTGFFTPDRACTIIGTSMINEVIQTIEQVDPTDLRGLLLYHTVPGRFIKIMNTAGGSSCTDIIKNMLCPDESFDDLFEKLDRIPIGSNGVTFHPYLFGERAPFKNPYAFASFFGMRNHNTKYDLMRAAYEGLAMSFVDCYQGKNGFDTMYLSGGASISHFVCQMFCDAIGMPVKRQTFDELGTLGIVKMLMVSLGYAESFAELEVDSYISYAPNMERHAQYRQLYEKFVSFRESIQSQWK